MSLEQKKTHYQKYKNYQKKYHQKYYKENQQILNENRNKNNFKKRYSHLNIPDVLIDEFKKNKTIYLKLNNLNKDIINILLKS